MCTSLRSGGLRSVRVVIGHYRLGGKFTDAVYGLVIHGALEGAEAGEFEAVLVGEGGDLLDAVNAQIVTQRVISGVAFECEDDGLGHAGIGRFGWEAEVKVELDVSGHGDHAALDDEYISAVLGDTSGDITRAGHIADDGTREKVVWLDDGLECGSDGDDEGGDGKGAGDVGADFDGGRAVNFCGKLLESVRAATDEYEASDLVGQ